MKVISKSFYCALVFFAGFVCALNLSELKYSIPEHWDGDWGSVGLSVLIAVVFSLLAAKD